MGFSHTFKYILSGSVKKLGERERPLWLARFLGLSLMSSKKNRHLISSRYYCLASSFL